MHKLTINLKKKHILQVSNFSILYILNLQSHISPVTQKCLKFDFKTRTICSVYNSPAKFKNKRNKETYLSKFLRNTYIKSCMTTSSTHNIFKIWPHKFLHSGSRLSNELNFWREKRRHNSAILE